MHTWANSCGATRMQLGGAKCTVLGPPAHFRTPPHSLTPPGGILGSLLWVPLRGSDVELCGGSVRLHAAAGVLPVRVTRQAAHGRCLACTYTHIHMCMHRGAHRACMRTHTRARARTHTRTHTLTHTHYCKGGQRVAITERQPVLGLVLRQDLQGVWVYVCALKGATGCPWKLANAFLQEQTL